MHSIIIFASGTGTNANAIIEHFKRNGKAKVSLIVSNKAEAGVLDIAQREEIPYLIVDRQTFHETLLIEQMNDHNPALIVLAGFLWKIPNAIIHAFPGRIINIHPALLPGYGGKGMYGHKVHNAVLAANDKESGITIHYVNEVYDEGNIILQARCSVEENDNADELASRIHKLEHFYYPRVIEFLLEQK
jgi:phosphoribosylglycinamide formyltransferase-1